MLIIVEEGTRLSPRVRGEPDTESGREVSIGVYPRVCGGTPSSLTERHSVAVYPRVCGGTPGQHRVVPRRGGLSPRVRGNPGPRWPSG